MLVNSLLKNNRNNLVHETVAGFALFFLLLLLPANAAAETVSVKYQDATFNVDASLTNGSVERITVDEDFTSIVLNVETAIDQEGVLTITLPRALIDARQGNSTNDSDDKFIVVAGTTEVDYEETANSESERVLSIAIPAGTERIEIVGTQVVPEFPWTAAGVLLLVFVTTISLSWLNTTRKGNQFGSS